MENERIPIGNATFALANQCIYPSTQCFGGIVFSIETSNFMISIFVGGSRFLNKMLHFSGIFDPLGRPNTNPFIG